MGGESKLSNGEGDLGRLPKGGRARSTHGETGQWYEGRALARLTQARVASKEAEL